MDCLLLKHIEGIRDFGSTDDESKSLKQGTFPSQLYGHSCDKRRSGVVSAQLRTSGVPGSCRLCPRCTPSFVSSGALLHRNPLPLANHHESGAGTIQPARCKVFVSL